MKTLKITRYYYQDYTIGVLTGLDKPIFTLELPWKDNQRNISCIPEGSYKVIKHNSPKFGNTLWFKEVKNRSEILIHSLNNTGQSRGCLGVGEQLTNQGTLINSKKALNYLLENIDNEIIIEISNDSLMSKLNLFLKKLLTTNK